MRGFVLALVFLALLSAGCNRGASTGEVGKPTSTATPAVAPEVQSQINAAEQADSARRSAQAARQQAPK